MTPPSDTDVRELIEQLRDDRRRYPFEAWARAKMELAATALESLLSDRAKLEERVRDLSGALEQIIEFDELEMKDGDGARDAAKAALNRSTDNG